MRWLHILFLAFIIGSTTLLPFSSAHSAAEGVKQGVRGTASALAKPAAARTAPASTVGVKEGVGGAQVTGGSGTLAVAAAAPATGTKSARFSGSSSVFPTATVQESRGAFQPPAAAASPVTRRLEQGEASDIEKPLRAASVTAQAVNSYSVYANIGNWTPGSDADGDGYYETYSFRVNIDADALPGPATVTAKVTCTTTGQAWWSVDPWIVTGTVNDVKYMTFTNADFEGVISGNTRLDFTVEIYDAGETVKLATAAPLSGEASPVLADVIPYAVSAAITGITPGADADSDGYYETFSFSMAVDADAVPGPATVYAKIICPTTGQSWWSSNPWTVTGRAADPTTFTFTNANFAGYITRDTALAFTVELYDSSKTTNLATTTVTGGPVKADNVFAVSGSIGSLTGSDADGDGFYETYGFSLSVDADAVPGPVKVLPKVICTTTGEWWWASSEWTVTGSVADPGVFTFTQNDFASLAAKGELEFSVELWDADKTVKLATGTVTGSVVRADTPSYAVSAAVTDWAPGADEDADGFYESYSFRIAVDAQAAPTTTAYVKIVSPTTGRSWFGQNPVALSAASSTVYYAFTEADFAAYLTGNATLSFGVEIWDATQTVKLATAAAVTGATVKGDIPNSYGVSASIGDWAPGSDVDGDGYYESYGFRIAIDADAVPGPAPVIPKIICTTTGQSWWSADPWSVTGTAADPVNFTFTQADFPSIDGNTTLAFDVELWDAAKTRLLATASSVAGAAVRADYIAPALSSLAISGPGSVASSSTGSYTATAAYSDGSTKVVNVSWSVSSPYATINSGGTLSAAAVATDQGVTLYAVYTEGGVTRSASRVVKILKPAVPVIDLSSLEDGTWTRSRYLNVTGLVSAGIELRWLRIAGKSVEIRSDRSFSALVILAPGDNVIVIEALQADGTYITETRTITLDGTLPEIEIFTADSISVDTSYVDITGTLPAGVVKVELKDALGSRHTATIIDGAFSATVDLVAGMNTIQIVATDTAGRESWYKRTVYYRPAAPSVLVTAPLDDLRVTESLYTIRGRASFSGAVTVSISVNGTVYHPAVAQDGSFEQAVTFPEEKLYTVIITISGEGGEATTVVRNILYSRGIIVINGNAATTVKGALQLALDYPGADQSWQMQFLFNNAAWSAWESYAAAKTVTVPAGSGIKHVFVRFRDALGTFSAIYSASIILDTTIPTGSVTINGGDPSTTGRDVVLSLSASDITGISAMQFSADGRNWDLWEPFSSTRIYTFPEGAGKKTVYVRFGDGAGNVSKPVSASILLSDLYYSGWYGGVLINGGDGYTKKTAATLTLTPPAIGYTSVRFSTNGTKWSKWETLKNPMGGANYSRTYPLSAADGMKTVFAQFRTAAGDVSTVYSDSIVLDRKAPTGSVIIDYGFPYTSSSTVELSLSAADQFGVYGFQYSVDGGKSWSGWETWTPLRTVTLPAGDGPKKVAVRFVDGAGNISKPFTAKVNLVTTLPGGTLKINKGGPATSSRAVTLSIAATGKPVALQVSWDGISWYAFEPFSKTLPVLLPEGQGIKYVYVRLLDIAGNLSEPLLTSILLQ